jgi:hypothetical protein
MKRLSAVLILLAAAGTAHAEDFSLNVNGHAVGVGLDGPLGRVASGAQGQYEVGGLFHSQSNADFNEGYVGLKVTGDMGTRPVNVKAGIGLRGLYLDGQGASGESVALDANLDARLPQLNRFVFSVEGLYSPDPLSFGDAKEYAELDLMAGYEVLHNARIFVGYRNVGVDFGGGRHTVDNGFLGGLRLTF